MIARPVETQRLNVIQTAINESLEHHKVAILPPLDVRDALHLLTQIGLKPRTIILDPWYNKGYGGVQPDYSAFIIELLSLSASVAPHVFLWGFPEIIAQFMDKLPESLILVAWLTWYYKNNPSVIRGWRSSQNACLHLSHPGASLYPENFLNEAQKKLKNKGKLRYMPGPTSVIEAPLPTQLDLIEVPSLPPEDVIEEPLLVGFVGKKEQTGHPSQKPVAVLEKLILMTTQENDLVFDPMVGSGTSAVAAQQNGRLCIISDHSEEYTRISEKRLGVSRIAIEY